MSATTLTLKILMQVTKLRLFLSTLQPTIPLPTTWPETKNAEITATLEMLIAATIAHQKPPTM
jgi:hypothetical protein